MDHEYLPEHWRERIADHARSESGGRYSMLSAMSFKRESVRLRFPDGSEALFHFAFFLTDEDRKELAVFTEHCGYHVFPLIDTFVEIVPY